MLLLKYTNFQNVFVVGSEKKKMEEQPKQNKVLQVVSQYLSIGSIITLLLAVCMLITGSINTLSFVSLFQAWRRISFIVALLATKFQNLSVVKGLGDRPGVNFEHALFCQIFFV